jgi:hypothetical protein
MNPSEINEIGKKNNPIRLILSRKTESLRFYLLIISFIDIMVINVGFFPKEINLFNIKLEQINYQSFITLLLFLTIFFTAVFIFFSSIDWINLSLIKQAQAIIYNWESKKINLGVDKYQKVIDELKKVLEQDPEEIQKQVKLMSQTFFLHPKDNFYNLESRLEKNLYFAKLYQIVLPVIEIIIPALFGLYASVITILELL